jgi:hypothetical protein
VVYSKAWVSLNCSHEEEGIIIIIGPFLDGNVTSQPPPGLAIVTSDSYLGS